MKIVFVLLLAFCSVSNAQSLTTNFVTAHADFRVVRGQLYNVSKSALATEIHGRIMCVSNNVAIMTTTVLKTNWVSNSLRSDDLISMGNFYGANPNAPVSYRKITRVTGPTVAITNLPEADLVWEKQGVWKAVRVDRFGYLGSPIALYDLGAPHVVPVVVTNHAQ